MEENKYYTPEIDEFFVGFEFEIKSIYVEPGAEVVLEKIMSDYDNFGNSGIQHETNWVKELLNMHYKLENINRYINQGRIRVKNLNVSDIESVGFVLVKEYSDELVFQLNDGDYCFYELILDLDIDNRIRIEQWTQGKMIATILPIDQWSCFNIFCGVIKNKSELIKVLKMLGIK